MVDGKCKSRLYDEIATHRVKFANPPDAISYCHDCAIEKMTEHERAFKKS